MCAEEELDQPMVFLGDRLRGYLETGIKPAKQTAQFSSTQQVSPIPPSGTAIIAPPPPGPAIIPTGQNCPADMVYIPDGHFCIDKYEYPNQEGRIPKTRVTRSDATALCIAQGKHLPTENEFTKACAGPNNNKYTYGNKFEMGTCQNISSTKPIGSRAQPVVRDPVPSGTKPGCRSEYGVYDMSGNLMELISDGLIRSGWYSAKKGDSCSFIIPIRKSGSVKLAYKSFAEVIGFRCAMNAAGIAASGPYPSTGK